MARSAGEAGKWAAVHALPPIGDFRGMGEVFDVVSDDPDFEYVLIGSPICGVRAAACGAKGVLG